MPLPRIRRLPHPYPLPSGSQPGEPIVPPDHWRWITRLRTPDEIHLAFGTARMATSDPENTPRDDFLASLYTFPCWFLTAPHSRQRSTSHPRLWSDEISNSEVESDNDEVSSQVCCTICLMLIQETEFVCLGCSAHFYHAWCLWEWFNTLDSYGVFCRCCPNCRQQLYRSEDEHGEVVYENEEWLEDGEIVDEEGLREDGDGDDENGWGHDAETVEVRNGMGITEQVSPHGTLRQYEVLFPSVYAPGGGSGANSIAGAEYAGNEADASGSDDEFAPVHGRNTDPYDADINMMGMEDVKD